MTIPSTSKHTLDDDPSTGTRSIKLSNFRIQSTKLPILTIPEADHPERAGRASTDLDLALPEIIFGNNRLSIKHEPSGFELEWNTLDMLKEVKKGQGWEKQPGSGALRVAHADEWTRGQSSTNSTSHMTIVKPFDWTYTTLHPGTIISSADSTWERAPPTHPGIPLALLARTDIPILFFDEVPLFEDELGDNGIADVTIRVRVNSTSFYVLARYALRIDHVLFRHFDVRVYHEFGSREIVRELKGRQSTYEQVKARLSPTPSTTNRSNHYSPANPSISAGGAGGRIVPNSSYPNISIPSRTPFSTSISSTAPRRSPSDLSSSSSTSTSSSSSMITPEDLTKLTDPNWVASVLEQNALEEEMQGYDPMSRNGASRTSAEGGEGNWEGKGRKLEVLKVPW
ncbi:Tip41p [Sporobolomyces salmoneus]|uniref:Tip41p n=1 Tax=Sporobolomyces salmoneus TaxID=183962 RepID=UPI0031706B63